MRIGINARLLLSGRMEGIARYIYETTRRMVAAHPEDEFFFFFDRSYDESFVTADNVTAVKIGLPARHPQLFKLWFEFSIPRALKKYKIDVFFSGDTYASLRSDVPCVLVSHDLAYKHFPEHLPKHHLKYYQTYFRKFHAKADKIVAVSNATKEDIIKQYGTDPNKIVIGHNASPDGFAPVTDAVKKSTQERYSHGLPYFTYLGSLHPRKNIVKLIEAFNDIKSKKSIEHQLVIIGRPAWNFDEIQAAYDSSPYKDEIHMYHDIKEEAKQILASAEALVYISTFEGFGIPILEAFSAQVPVITSNISSMPEVAGDAAILVDPNDVEEISGAIHRIITDDKLRSELIKKGADRTSLFVWEKTATTIYEQICKVKK